MAAILKVAGFGNLESLQEFSNRFPNVPNFVDDDLGKIWICHKNERDVPVTEEINLSSGEDYTYLSKIILKKIAAGKHFYSLLTEFSAFTIFNKIYAQFNGQLTNYLFRKCYLFYNWGINALEPIIDHFEIHSKIQRLQTRGFRNVHRVLYNHFNCWHSLRSTKSTANREICTVLTDDQLVPSDSRKPKGVSLKRVLKAVKQEVRFYDCFKNKGNPYNEKFNLKRILYDMKERPWPRQHVLYKTVDDLIKFIIRVPVVTGCNVENELLDECRNWVLLREMLEKFIKNHEALRRNDGYGRVLKKHLKNVKIPNDRRRLHPIPKPNICSYVLDILRRTLPVGLFGRNSVRKTFFSELTKVIKGNKDEDFIWYPLLRRILTNKSKLPWCAQLGSNYKQSQIILKLFKFLVIHYVFIILRNNFYITETGSSGFALRFYRKSDMESASCACVKNLLREGSVRRLSKTLCCGESTVERNWLNTGVIAERDLRSNLKKSMTRGTEYIQPVAHVRFLPKSDCSDELRIITYIVDKSGKCSNANSGIKKLEKYFTTRLANRKKNLFIVKLFLHYLVDKKGFGIRPLPCNKKLEAAWTKALYLKEKHGKLFFVKADISDAFGSVNHDTLLKVLRNAFEEEVKEGKVELKKIIEWKKTNCKVEKVARFSFSNRAAENSIMINRSVFLYHDKKINRYLDTKFLDIIDQVVTQQKIEIKGRIFRLTKGLAQGSAGKFSTHLCEIYYSSMDNSNFGRFVDSTDAILVRGVDDYLFITPDREKAQGFLDLVQNSIPGYNVRFNNHKLKSNLTDDVKEVLYLGLMFNFEEMWVKPSYSRYQGKDLLPTVNLLDKWGSNHFNKEIFLKRRSLLLKCLKLHPIVTSRIHNSLKIMRQTVFEACLVQALRVITLADYLFCGQVKNDSAVYRTLLLSCSRIKKAVASSQISPEEVNWLFFFSTLNILRKYSGQFKILSLVIRYRLQKCEKTFASNGTELFLNLLKNDILNERYWKEVSENFKVLSQQPLKLA